MGGCLSVIVLLLILAALMIYMAGALVVVDVVLLILFVWSLSTYSKLKRVSPSVMKCRNCGSDNVKLSTRGAGFSSGTLAGSFWMSRRANVEYERIATCQDCGFTWNYITTEDILIAQRSVRARAVIFGIILAVFFSITCFMFSGLLTEHDDKPEPRKVTTKTVSAESLDEEV